MWNAVHAVILDRGPLWFEGHGTFEDFEGFLKAFKAEFPKRFGRKRRFIPEIEDSPEIRAALTQNGFTHQSGTAYETRILNLEKPMEDLRADLKKRWRNALSKAEKQKLEIEWDDTGQYLGWLLKVYSLDRAAKGYDGPSAKLIYALAKAAIPRKDMLLARALKDGHAVGAVLIFKHAPGATYQIGWNSPDGRSLGAHYILLWKALNMLKQQGIATFDLGGTNDDTAKGVKTFKDGMGGCRLNLPGIYH